MRLWPDRAEQLLLTAALGDGETALRAFADWRASIDWDAELDGGSFRLLPLLHANLRRLGCTDPLMRRLAGIYRHSWCETQVHLHTGARIIAMVQAAQVPVMVSKGLLLAHAYYASPALRPMSDIDLFVPADRALETLALLSPHGWVPAPGVAKLWAGRQGDMLAMVNGIGMYHDRDGEIDVHWRLLPESTGDAQDAQFWRDATPVQIGTVEVWRPSPTHLLLHVMAHGLRPNPMSPLRWIADAAMILRVDGQRIDWDELMTTARVLHVGNRVGRGLAYLRDTMGFDIPAGAGVGASTWVELIEERAFQASIVPTPARLNAALVLAATVARLAVTDARRHLPRLGARWLGRRLLPWRLAR